MGANFSRRPAVRLTRGGGRRASPSKKPDPRVVAERLVAATVSKQRLYSLVSGHDNHMSALCSSVEVTAQYRLKLCRTEGVYSCSVVLLQRPAMVSSSWVLSRARGDMTDHDMADVDRPIIGVCLSALLILVFFTFVVLSAP